MFYIERSSGDGTWDMMMASPHRLGIDDLHGPPVGPNIGQGDLYASLPTPGNKSHFAGRRGWKARVRHNDTLVELYAWDRIMDNEFDPDSDYKWGWKLVVNNRECVPYEQLYPLSFVG